MEEKKKWHVCMSSFLYVSGKYIYEQDIKVFFLFFVIIFGILTTECSARTPFTNFKHKHKKSLLKLFSSGHKKKIKNKERGKNILMNIN